MNKKKLIEFGWDYPSVTYLQNNLKELEKTPFDGVVFSFDFKIYDAFDTVRYADSLFQFYQLSKIPWKSFTDNFILVRGASLNGAEWLNDRAWKNISYNLTKVSKAVLISKSIGIGFDPEYYNTDANKNPWRYDPILYGGLSYAEVGKFVRKRGNQFIKALETSSPSLKILCFWLLELVEAQNRSLPLSKTGMALYPFFIQGILEGKNDKSEIIDGNEFSYWYESADQFIVAGQDTRAATKRLIPSDLLPEFKKISFASSIYLDGLYAKSVIFDKGYDTLTKKRWLLDNLYNALKTTDKYVWFYSEKVNWWKNEVDSGLSKIILNVKNRINSEFDAINYSADIFKSFSNYQFKNGNIELQLASALYNPITNVVKISTGNSSILTIKLYKNSHLFYTKERPPTNFIINLKNLYNKSENLIILSKQSNGNIGKIYLN